MKDPDIKNDDTQLFSRTAAKPALENTAMMADDAAAPGGDGPNPPGQQNGLLRPPDENSD